MYYAKCHIKITTPAYKDLIKKTTNSKAFFKSPEEIVAEH